MSYIQFNDIPLDPSLTQQRSQRVQRAQFGDGYSQILTDGLNAEQETWQCQTPPLTYPEINSIEKPLQKNYVNGGIYVFKKF